MCILGETKLIYMLLHWVVRGIYWKIDKERLKKGNLYCTWCNKTSGLTFVILKTDRSITLSFIAHCLFHRHYIFPLHIAMVVVGLTPDAREYFRENIFFNFLQFLLILSKFLEKISQISIFPDFFFNSRISLKKIKKNNENSSEYFLKNIPCIEQ